MGRRVDGPGQGEPALLNGAGRTNVAAFVLRGGFMFRLRSAAVFTAAAGVLVFAGSGAASADTGAQGVAYGSSGVLSGNVVQVPVHIPVNACGNSLNVIALLNPTFGNACFNDGDYSGDDKRGGDMGKHDRDHTGEMNEYGSH